MKIDDTSNKRESVIFSSDIHHTIAYTEVRVSK
jgi:hypothetical protein